MYMLNSCVCVCVSIVGPKKAISMATRGRHIHRTPCRKEVPIDAYIQGVYEWLATPPVCPVRTKCGAKLATHFRHVTPGMVMALLPLVSFLVEAGLTTGVCQISKLEQALRIHLGSNAVCRGSDQDLEKLVYDVANHIQQIFAVLRYIKQEDCCQNPDQYRRFPKTGGIRHRLASSDWAVVSPILQKLDLNAQAAY
jgi:hypothetical protein